MSEKVLDIIKKGLDENQAKFKELLGNKADNETLEDMKKSLGEVNEGVTKNLKEVQSEIAKLKALKTQESQDAKSDLVKQLNKAKGEGSFRELFSKSNLGKQIELTSKAVTTMTIASAFTGQVTRFDQRPDIVNTPERRIRIRSLLPTIIGNSNEYSYKKYAGGEGDIDVVAEATAFPEMDMDFVEEIVSITKLAGQLTTSDEILDDTDQLESFINNKLREKMFDKEDTQLLYGTGLTNQVDGINTTSGKAANVAFRRTSPTDWDAVAGGMDYLYANEFMPQSFVTSSTDYINMTTLRGTDGHYLRDMLVWMGGTPFFLGVPMTVSNAVNAGEFFLWDNQALDMVQRKAIELARSTENGSNFVEGKVTFTIQERLNLAKYHDNGLFSDSYANVKTVIGGA